MSCYSDSVYPFTALVGQEKMKSALLLNAINPKIGGVLIRGEKGTAKSTAARALADLLPEIEVVADCPFGCNSKLLSEMCHNCRERLANNEEVPIALRKMKVVDLPQNATEDRVVGTLDIEHAIKTGEKKFEPGVLAQAHRNILYVDEVNLLDDHIVDVLLDAAAMGQNTVEREGISYSHPSHFILVGTMNPEEGELRPQLLDRFALCVEIEGIADLEQRVEIVKRRAAYESDPKIFVQGWKGEQHALQDTILKAKDLLPEVKISDSMLHLIAEICISMAVQGHRADIVIARTAATIAAFEGRTEVAEVDVKKAAELALPHRMRRKPFEEQKLDQDKLNEIIEKHQDQEKEYPGKPPEMPLEDERERKLREEVFEVGLPQQLPKIEFDRGRIFQDSPGGRKQNAALSKIGKYVGSVFPRGKVGDIAFDATLRAAAPHQREREGDLAINIQTPDLREKVKERKVGSDILFVVDASGSMGAKKRMVAAKGAILSLLTDAYQRRDRAGMVAFRKENAEILLPFTSSLELAHQRLRELPTGGKTPLALGLLKGLELSSREKDTHRILVLLSDGKANVGFDGSPLEDAKGVAQRIREEGIKMVVIDTEDGELSLAKEVAEAAQAQYIKLPEVTPDLVASTVRSLDFPE
jgi:magnesium chelatase subunit D